MGNESCQEKAASAQALQDHGEKASSPKADEKREEDKVFLEDSEGVKDSDEERDAEADEDHHEEGEAEQAQDVSGDVDAHSQEARVQA